MSQQEGNLYILLGRLGAGKTTFIRKLLASSPGAPYAIIQNEFSSEVTLGIEQAIIVNEAGTPFNQFLELPNGCICCSTKNDLMAGIQYILNNTPVRNIVVEANGLAEPAETIKQFWFDEQQNIKAKIHSLIICLSLLDWQKTVDDRATLDRLAYANKVLLTFVDKAPKQEIEAASEFVRKVNPLAIICKNDYIDFKSFMEQGRLLALEPQMFEASLKEQHFPGNHRHGIIDSIFIRGRCLVQNNVDFQHVIGQLLWQSGLEVMRIKGLLCFPSEKTAFELQAVTETFELTRTALDCVKVAEQSRVLVIGRNLNRSFLERTLGFKTD